MDADVSSTDRQPLQATTLAFLTAALGSNPGEAYAMFTAEARAVTSSEAFAAQMRATQVQAGPLRDLRLAHTYLIESSGEGAAEAAVCGNLKSPDKITVELTSERKQAYVAFTARTQNGDWVLTVLLLPDAGKWMIGWVNFGVATMAGRSANDVLQLARSERKSGHGFNALMLYVALRALVDRGQNVHLAIAEEAEHDFGTLEVPPEVRGPPPYTWNLDGKEYPVAQMTIIGLEGKLGLIFMLPLTTWSGAIAVDKYNRAFLGGFMAAHPDYSRVYEFLAARAIRPDKSGGYGTIYQVGKGFGEPPTAD